MTLATTAYIHNALNEATTVIRQDVARIQAAIARDHYASGHLLAALTYQQAAHRNYANARRLCGIEE